MTFFTFHPPSAPLSFHLPNSTWPDVNFSVFHCKLFHTCVYFQLFPSFTWSAVDHPWNQQAFYYSRVGQCLRLSTSLSVPERRPPKPMLCLLERDEPINKSVADSLAEVAWGCKLSLWEKDGWRAKERGKRWTNSLKKRKARTIKSKRERMERNEDVWNWRKGEGLEVNEGEERGCVCVCFVWCKPWVLFDGWI